MTRPHTASERCAECALNRNKKRRFNAAEEGEFMDFEEAVRTETPFWCHGGNGSQVCRGWLAIMERRWASQGWDVENPRDQSLLSVPKGETEKAGETA
jgi:hypothetical protein